MRAARRSGHEPTPGGAAQLAEPWETPRMQAQARAHEEALRRRRRRQSLIFLLAVLLLALVFLIALALARRGVDDRPAASPATTSCANRAAAQPDQTSVRVLNSTARKGVAGKVAGVLRTRGYEVSSVGNAQRGLAGDAPVLIVHGPGGTAQARAVAAQLPGAVLRTDARTSATVDLIIGDGYQGTRSVAEAEAQLRQPDPTACPTTT